MFLIPLSVISGSLHWGRSPAELGIVAVCGSAASSMRTTLTGCFRGCYGYHTGRSGSIVCLNHNVPGKGAGRGLWCEVCFANHAVLLPACNIIKCKAHVRALAEEDERGGPGPVAAAAGEEGGSLYAAGAVHRSDLRARGLGAYLTRSAGLCAPNSCPAI